MNVQYTLTIIIISIKEFTCICMHVCMNVAVNLISYFSLNIEFKLLQNNVFNKTFIISAHPHLNVILSWLRQLFTESRSSSVTVLVLPLTPLT